MNYSILLMVGVMGVMIWFMQRSQKKQQEKRMESLHQHKLLSTTTASPLKMSLMSLKA